MAGFQTEKLCKVYPSGTVALYDFNLNASDREFIAVTGGEASGKTTLLRLIAGLDDVTSGEIKIDGKTVNDLEPKDRDISMIFPNNSLYPSLNVYDNMAYGLKLRNGSPAIIEQRVKAAANILGLSDVLYRKPKALSSAQKQKVALGRAIVREPKLYLLDDPVSGLNGALRAEMLSVIVNLQARMQGTFVYATKNVAEAMSVATRVVVLKDGFVQQIDTPANLYDYPANSYVAFYVGSPKIGFIRKAHVEEREEDVYAVYDGGELKLAQSVADRLDKAYIGTNKPVTMGLRPEDLSLTQEGGISATVAKVIETGGKSFADCDLVNGATLTVPCEGAEKGQAVKISVDCERVYLFDEETQRTVLSRDGGYTETGRQEASLQPRTQVEEEEIKKGFAPAADKKKKGKS